MANTLLGQTQYTYGTLYDLQQTTSSNALGGLTYYPTGNQVYYCAPSEAEKAGKAIAILKELRADGFIQIDSVDKFCEMIDKIASKI